MMIAPGVVGRSVRGPKRAKAVSKPRPEPGFDSTMNRMERPASWTWAVPSGVRMPWLIALLRNKTLPGSTNRDARGSSPAVTRAYTPFSSAPTITAITGPMASLPRTAISSPTMPIEKVSMSISKPAGTLPSMTLSRSLRTKAASGPMIMAPRNMGMSTPTMTPIVAMAPMTAPRWPCTMRPPV